MWETRAPGRELRASKKGSFITCAAVGRAFSGPSSFVTSLSRAFRFIWVMKGISLLTKLRALTSGSALADECDFLCF
jgi:hypothetical protein